jgi:hypothetical protein
MKLRLYSEFLNTMVHRTVEVARKMNLVELDSLMEYGQNNTKLQCELMANICVFGFLRSTHLLSMFHVDGNANWFTILLSTHFRVVISTCKNRVKFNSFVYDFENFIINKIKITKINNTITYFSFKLLQY